MEDNASQACQRFRNKLNHYHGIRAREKHGKAECEKRADRCLMRMICCALRAQGLSWESIKRAVMATEVDIIRCKQECKEPLPDSR